MEKKVLSRRGLIGLSAVFLVIVGILTGVLVEKSREAEGYRRYLDVGREKAFQELSTAVDEINTSLQKASYTNSSAMISALCTQIYGKATAAQIALGELPYANVELEQTATFLSRLGDYACALSRRISNQEGWTEEELEIWEDLCEHAETLDRQLAELEADLQAGHMSLESVEEVTDRLSREETETSGSLYKDIESEFNELPTLIYDGPFSQHLEGQEPKALRGLDTITMEQARGVAAELLGISVSQVELVSEMDSELEGWLFSARWEGAPCSLWITKRGGKVAQAFTATAYAEARLDAEDCVAAAKHWLNAQGYENMSPTYYHQEDGVLTVNFCYEQDGGLFYPDMVKVTVSLANGKVTGLDARGYLMHHEPRTVDPPAVSEDTALTQVPDWMEVLSTRLSVIPSEGEYDLLCWEIKCEDKEGRHVIYYVDCNTGETQRLFLLIEDENGTLVL